MRSLFQRIRSGPKAKSLRSYAAFMFTGITALALAVTGVFFYAHTARTLRETYQEQMFQQLNNTMSQIGEQVELMDSLYPLFMSNTLIYDSLETSSADSYSTTAIERQMTYLLITNYAWKENFIDSVTIYSKGGQTYRVSTVDDPEDTRCVKEIYRDVDKKRPSLQLIRSEEKSGSLYFTRNIFSSSTGDPIATMIISVNGPAWVDYLSRAIDDDWSIFLYNEDFELSSLPGQSAPFDEREYLTVSEKLDDLDLSAVVVAPRQELQQKLSETLRTYLAVIVFVSAVTLLAAYVLSKVFTRPVMRMIDYVTRISEGHYEESIPATEMYDEFNALTDAFNHLLREINAYHADQLEKQMLLKNAEIQALQSQINPHFLFNTLNTLAWKAQMADNPELYQMVISLGALLKTNILSKSSSYISLEEELRCIKFYIYLQQMRFEDKITVNFDLAPGLQKMQIPCFCLQSLVENAFEHGLEPKKGSGELLISICREDSAVRFSVRDDGVGFTDIPDLDAIQPSAKDSHTHIGLRNLDRRLYLLYGEMARLHIVSEPDVSTEVSFRIPLSKEETP